MVHCLLLLSAMPMPVHWIHAPSPCFTSMHETSEMSKYEYEISEITNPQSYCGDEISLWTFPGQGFLVAASSIQASCFNLMTFLRACDESWETFLPSNFPFCKRPQLLIPLPESVHQRPPHEKLHCPSEGPTKSLIDVIDRPSCLTFFVDLVHPLRP